MALVAPSGTLGFLPSQAPWARAFGTSPLPRSGERPYTALPLTRRTWNQRPLCSTTFPTVGRGTDRGRGRPSRHCHSAPGRRLLSAGAREALLRDVLWVPRGERALQPEATTGASVTWSSDRQRVLGVGGAHAQCGSNATW